MLHLQCHFGASAEKEENDRVQKARCVMELISKGAPCSTVGYAYETYRILEYRQRNPVYTVWI